MKAFGIAVFILFALVYIQSQNEDSEYNYHGSIYYMNEPTETQSDNTCTRI